MSARTRSPEFLRSAATLERPRTRTSFEAGEVVTGAIVPPESWKKPVLAVLATDVRQNDGLALSMDGCDLKRYRRNNVLIVGHNVRSLAVGSVEDIRVADIVIDDDGEIHVDAPFGRAGKRVKGLVGRLDFDRNTAAGREAEASVRSGKTRGISIGFDIDKSSRDWRTGRVGKWWPTETSLLAVPMDEFARVYSRSYAPADEEADMFDDVDPTELRRALVSLCERLGVSFSARAFDPDFTRAGDAKPMADDDDEYMLNDTSEDEDEEVDDEESEEDEDADDEDGDEEMGRGYESEFIRVDELPDLLAEYGLQPQYARAADVDVEPAEPAEPIVHAEAVDNLRAAFVLTV